MTAKRQYSPVDNVLSSFNRVLDTLFTAPRASRPFPAKTVDNPDLSESDRARAGRYMRVNHVGEICAQALYHSQAVTASSDKTRMQMEEAAREEVDHLAWCEQRLNELGSRKSYLNPVWYAGAFSIGALAGLAGDRWNLGFVAETERQVVEHLEDHLGKLPSRDFRSREVVSAMKADEARHAEHAVSAGAAEFPQSMKSVMKGVSRVMTSTAHWI